MERSSVARGSLAVFIADANVLIDYFYSDFDVLGLFAKHVGHVYVLGILLRDEVRGVTAAHCTKAGLIVVEAGVETLVIAAQREQGSLLSFYDWLCLLEAKKRGAACLT